MGENLKVKHSFHSYSVWRIGKEPEPPKFIEPIQTATVTQGDMARFECVVTGRPMPEITWFHGEKMIKPSDLIEIGQDTEGRNWVVVRNATPKILGTFTCWAENQVGRTMCGAELTLMSGKWSGYTRVNPSAVNHHRPKQNKIIAIYVSVYSLIISDSRFFFFTFSHYKYEFLQICQRPNHDWISGSFFKTSTVCHFLNVGFKHFDMKHASIKP